MSQDVLFSAAERKFIAQYLDKERITSFSQTIWPFIFFFVPSLFLFVVFLYDGEKGTAAIAYVLLCLPYFLSAYSAKERMLMFANVVEKFNRRLKAEERVSSLTSRDVTDEVGGVTKH